MFSRVTQLEIDLIRTSAEQALGVFTEQVLPGLRQQPGYEGVYVFVNPEGKGMIVSFWASEEAASAGVSEGWYAQQLQEHVALFRSPPGRDRYQVVFAEAPAPAAG